MINGIVKTSYVDYPERLCSMIFIGGCNMRCPYCHNPEIVFRKTSIIKEDEIFPMLEKRKDLVGAVCISGGEPTLWRGLKNFIIKIKKIGLLVKLDTNGTNPNVIKDLISDGLIDYIAIDVKAIPEKYELAAGAKVSTDKILESIQLVKESRIDYEFRTTVHSSYTSKEDILTIADSIAPAKRYILQNFVSRDQHIDNNSRLTNTFSPFELFCLKEQIMSKNQINEVFVR